jgi:lactoylglutathione lyase
MTVLSVMPHLYVADVGRAAAFYRDLLGGAQTFRHPADGPAEHVELRFGATVIALSARGAVLREGLPAPTAGHPLELTVECDDADAAVAALRAAGTPVIREPRSHFSGHRRAYVADPDGNWVALISKGPIGEDVGPAPEERVRLRSAAWPLTKSSRLASGT